LRWNFLQLQAALALNKTLSLKNSPNFLKASGDIAAGKADLRQPSDIRKFGATFLEENYGAP
jgi:hypothetical protein